MNCPSFLQEPCLIKLALNPVALNVFVSDQFSIMPYLMHKSFFFPKKTDPINFIQLHSLMVQPKCLKSMPKPEANLILRPHKSLQFSLFCVLDVSRINPRTISSNTARPFTMTPIPWCYTKLKRRPESAPRTRSKWSVPATSCSSDLVFNAVSSINTLDALPHEISQEKRREKEWEGRKLPRDLLTALSPD